MTQLNNSTMKKIEDEEFEENNAKTSASKNTNTIINEFIYDTPKQEYQLNFDEKLMFDITNFCKHFHISHDKLVEIIMEMRLTQIESDIEVEEYILIASYLGLSRLVSRNIEERKEKEPGGKQVIVKLNKKLRRAIEAVCSIIFWNQERFIENSVEYWTSELIDRIDNHQLEFLEEFIDFSEVLEVIREVLKGDK